jgi:hypothetical protein
MVFMSRRCAIAGIFLTIVSGLPLAHALCAQTAAQSGALASGQPAGANQWQSEAQLRELGAILIANQHKNDDALDKYERTEHELDTTGGASPRTLTDKTTRLVPNGAGTTKLLLSEGGRAVSASDYHTELQLWVNVLQFMVNPNDSRNKTATAKYVKRQQSRSELVDAMLTAFTHKWLTREMRDGHDCDVILLQPDPSFHSKSILEDALTHAVAKIWVDHQANQMVHAEAQITSDFSVGGGVLGKLYKGGTFSMDQAEVAPGVWLPTRYQFDFSGRKFLFSFEEHQSIVASHYRYIGSAKDAMAVAQSELTNPKPLAGDP